MLKRLTMLAVVLCITVVAAHASGYKNIMSDEAKNLLTKNKGIYLLDVRTPDEFRQARLKGSVLIPLSDVERRLAEIPKNRTILVYCAVGSRSNLVAGFLASKGYGEIYNMTDGIVGWYRQGYPIER